MLTIFADEWVLVVSWVWSVVVIVGQWDVLAGPWEASSILVEPRSVDWYFVVKMVVWTPVLLGCWVEAWAYKK